jgi:ketosteroid isomerase-like protein
MSQENVEIVRQRLTVAPRPHRSFEERLGLRIPGILAFLDRLVWRLPPHSWLRRAAFRRAVQRGAEASNRRDYEAAFFRYDPQAELITDSWLIELGFDPVYRGLEEHIRWSERWIAEWGDFRFVPEELIDFCDGRALVSGHTLGCGLSSGAGFASDWAMLLTVAAGRVIREQFFFDRAEALEAAGLRE